MIIAALICVLALLAVGGLGLGLRIRQATEIVYGTCAALTLCLCALSLAAILAPPAAIVLPLGIPWLGAHFRIDALAAAFLTLVNLGGLGASIYGIGYGRHEDEPARVLPFYPVFLAAMNLVVLADDAYSFLFAWELMSLASWALVMSRHRSPETARAGYLYLIMASGGTFALLLAFGRDGVVGRALYDWTGVQLTFSTAGAVLAETFVAMPFLVITVEAALRTMDRRYEEAAAALGAGRWTTFRRVTLPIISSSVVAGAALTWARALGEFGATITFAGDVQGRTQTLPLAVYLALQGDEHVAIALSLALLVVSIVVLVALRGRWLGALRS